MQPTHVMLNAALVEMLETTGPLDPAATWVHVFSSITDRGVNTLLADVIQAPQAQYPRQVLVSWGTPYQLIDGSPVADAPPIHFAPPDNTHPQLIAGWYLADSLTVGNLLAYQILPSPVMLNVTTDVWTLVLRATLDQAGRWDVSRSWNG